MSLEITGQSELAVSIQAKTNQLLSSLSQRVAVWEKIEEDKKKLWLNSGNDPILSLGWEVYRGLKDFYEEIDHA